MAAKFAQEQHHVELLLARLGAAVDGFADPNAGARSDAGIDVIASIAGRRVGIQVGVIDPNRERARRGPKKSAWHARLRMACILCGVKATPPSCWRASAI
jgi:hypothetical protein